MLQKRIVMKILKPLRDIALIFYDDLEFKAMSLPRLGAGVITAMVAVTWYQILFKGRSFEYFDALATLCGGVWAAYSFKKWTGRRDCGHDAHQTDRTEE